MNRGAEAVVREESNSIYKKRVEKSYRHPELDSRLRKKRTEREKRILERCQKYGVNVPEVKEVTEYEIEMEVIEGDILKRKANARSFRMTGKQIGKMHGCDVFHSDITTSNIIMCSGDAFIIDFGLSRVSQRTEDKAVDISLFKQNIKSFHKEEFEKLFDRFKQGYRETADSTEPLNRLDEIESRKRYI